MNLQRKKYGARPYVQTFKNRTFSVFFDAFEPELQTFFAIVESFTLHTYVIESDHMSIIQRFYVGLVESFLNMSLKFKSHLNFLLKTPVKKSIYTQKRRIYDTLYCHTKGTT